MFLIKLLHLREFFQQIFFYLKEQEANKLKRMIFSFFCDKIK